MDNGFTPYVAVKVDGSTRVPMEYVRNGEIVLNISADATRNLKIGNELIQFSARFNGVSREVSVPVAAVAASSPRRTARAWHSQSVGAERAGLTPVPMSEADSEGGDKPRPSGGGKPKLQIVK